MKTTRLRLLLATMLAMLVLHPVHARAQNQQEMNRQAEKDFATADAEMTKAYKVVAQMCSKQDLEELKVAQRLWIQFRDAQAKYEADLGARGGSMYPSIYEGRRAAITKARTAELNGITKPE